MRRSSRNAGNRQTFKRLLIMFWLALAAFVGQGQAKHYPPALDRGFAGCLARRPKRVTARLEQKAVGKAGALPCKR